MAMHCSINSVSFEARSQVSQRLLPSSVSSKLVRSSVGYGCEGFGFGGVGLAEDVGGADDGVLDVGAGLAFEAEGVFEVEGDDGVAGEAEHEVAEGADGDLCRDGEAFGGFDLGVAGVYFGFGCGDELVEEVVGFDAEALAAADFDVGLGAVFVADGVAEVDGAAGREGDHLVAEVGVVVGGFGVAHAAKGRDDVVLRVVLA